MATVKPFIPTRFKEDITDDWGTIFTPPFDTIRKSEIPLYKSKNKYNVVQLILPDDYKESAQKITEWEKEGVLISDDKPLMFLLVQTYKQFNTTYTREGIFCILKLEEFDSKVVIPHEQTIKKHKEDRLNLMREVRGNLSPVFGIFNNPMNLSIYKMLKEKTGLEKIYSFIDQDKVENTVFIIKEESAVKKIQEILKGSPVLIADGHHRYETALNYKKELLRMKKEGKLNSSAIEAKASNYCLFYLSPLQQEGLKMFPTHRVLNLSINEDSLLKKLRQFFELKEARVPEDEELFSCPEDSFFVMYKGRVLQVKINSSGLTILEKQVDEELKRINAVIIEKIIFENILGYENISQKGIVYYYHRVDEVLNHLNKSKKSVGFLLSPIKVEDVFNISYKGVRFPAKTTYFYPKVPTGLTFYLHQKQKYL